MTTTTTAAVEELVRQLQGLGTVRREIGRHALAELGTQGFSALAAIHGAGSLRVSEVAAVLQVDLSVASRQVGALATSGYVVRHVDARDRRAQRLALTPAGERALQEAHRRMVAAFAEVLDAWTPDELAQLAAGLERLRADFTSSAQRTEREEAPA